MSGGKRLAAGVLLILAALTWSAACTADVRAKISVDASDGVGTVLINREPAIRFRAGNGSLTPGKRAEITAGRLQEFVASGLDPKTISSKGDRTSARVYAGEQLICIASAADAKANKTSPLALAESWALNARSLLLMPPIVLTAEQLLVALGESRLVGVRGAAEGIIYSKFDKDGVAQAEADSETRCVQVTGTALGETSLWLCVEGEYASIPVIVRKYAGSMPGLVVAEVTGDPCPVSLVQYAAKHAVFRSAELEPGSSVLVGEVDPCGGALAQGGSRNLTVPVKIMGPDYITRVSEACVEVRNVGLSPEQPDCLFYSNFPERLTKYQTLFAGLIQPEQVTRVLYHHQNAIGKRVHLIVEVINPNTVPTRVRVVRGVSRPLIDTVLVGYIAGSEFLADMRGNVSVIEMVPPQSRLVLVSDMLDHLDTASGILQLTQMDGFPAYVRVNAVLPGMENVSCGTIVRAPDPAALHLSDHVYISPAKYLEATYEVGGRWAFIPLGKHAIDDTSAQKKLYGNYGVTYDIKVKLENPTGETKKVSVLFEPSAGLASGVFLVDGKFVSTKYAQPPDEFPLASYQMRPGEVRDVHIVTIPLAGSNYPATLVVRA